MNQPENINYLVIVQCDIVMQRCSGYFCEKAFAERTGGFSGYPREKSYRTLHLTCGGCCGLALHRKLNHVARQIAKYENVAKERIAVQLSSCITKDNYHGPPCPHLDYLKTLLAKLGAGPRRHPHQPNGRKATRRGALLRWAPTLRKSCSWIRKNSAIHTDERPRVL